MPNNKTDPRGVGLYTEEWAELEKIAKKNNSTLHAMACYALRYFIKEYKRGKIQIKKEEKIARP